MEYLKTSTGMNFTKIKFDNESEFKEFLKDHADLFRIVGYSGGKQKDGTWIIVY